MSDKKTFYGISIIAACSLFLTTLYYYDPIHIFLDSYKLYPLLMVFGIVVGAGTYAMMSEKIEKKEKAFKETTDIILKFLNYDEKKVVEKLMENKGKVLQAEITRLPNMSKLRSHRAVKKLEAKKIIIVEKFGKTNTIKLSNEIRDVLF